MLKLLVNLSNSSYLPVFFLAAVLLLTILVDRTMDGEGCDGYLFVSPVFVFCRSWGSGFIGLILGGIISYDLVDGC